MFIIHELYNTAKENHYTACTLGTRNSQVVRNKGTFRQMLQHAQQSPENKKIILLDEQRFSWLSTPIAFCAIKPCTVQDMYAIIEPIINRHGGHDTKKLFYHIDAITINGKAEDFYIGKQGNIHCMLHVVALQRDDWYIAKSALGTDIAHIHFYPSSFFTLHHIKKTLDKDSGTLLFIGQYHTKRITFEKGIFQACEVVELGRQILKDIYTENNIREFFDIRGEKKDSKNDIETITSNSYAKNLIEQSVRFYVDMLMRWLRSYTTQGNIFLVSDMVQNTYFMDIFSKLYQQDTMGFILPLAHVQGLKDFGKTWGYEDIDVQTAAHYFV